RDRTGSLRLGHSSLCQTSVWGPSRGCRLWDRCLWGHSLVTTLSTGQRGSNGARMLGSRNWRAMRDTRRYRHNYPDLIERDGNGDMPNLSFYRNEIRFLPNGCFIEDILQNWREDYDLLEENHSYIQWRQPARCACNGP
ncbi:unnamed protein product, partial [Gulo gulo]